MKLLFFIFLPYVIAHPLDFDFVSERDVLEKLYSIQNSLASLIATFEADVISKEPIKEPCQLKKLEKAKIISVWYNKTLEAGSLATAYDEERRNVFVDRRSKGEPTESEQWIFIKIDGTNNQFRIKSLQTNEYLYAAAEDHNRTPERRRVFTWMNTTTTPESHPSFWSRQADWEIDCDVSGYTIKNLEYREFLYSAADDFAFDQSRRSVFAWKNYNTLGFEGIWKFEKIEFP